MRREEFLKEPSLRMLCHSHL